MNAISQQIARKGGLDVAALNGAYAEVVATRVLYVSSTHTLRSDLNNTGEDATRPFATIKAAVARLTALGAKGKYATILVAPEHVETVIAANGLDISVTGVTIRGEGAGSARPQIKVGTVTGATMRVSGNNCVLSNLRFVADIDALAVIVDVTGSNNKFTLCHVENDAAKQSLIGINIATGAAGTTIERCTSAQGTAGANSCISLAGVCDNTRIIDCQLTGNWAEAGIDILGAATNIYVYRNSVWNLNAASNKCVEFAAAASTGELSLNRFRNQTDASVAWITMGAGSLVWLIENYGVNNNQETGKLVGTPSV